MRLLVTGGAGYIGSVVATLLAGAGHEVVVIDDLSTGHADAVPAAAAFVKGTVRDHAQAVLAGARGPTRSSTSRPSRWWPSRWPSRRCTGSTTSGARSPCSRPCGSPAPRGSSSPPPPRSTGSRSASPSTRPRRPGRATPMARPSSPWTRRWPSTPGCTGSARSACGTSTSPAPMPARAAAWLGERHDPETHLIPNILQVALGDARPGTSVAIYGDDYPTPDGTCVRDYIHVADLARAHLLALDACAPGQHRIYNLGSGSGFSNLEVLQACREVTGHEIPAQHRPPAAGRSRRCSSPRPTSSMPNEAGGRRPACRPWSPMRGSSPGASRR